MNIDVDKSYEMIRRDLVNQTIPINSACKVHPWEKMGAKTIIILGLWDACSSVYTKGFFSFSTLGALSFSYTGQVWSNWIHAREEGALNKVHGARAINQAIISCVEGKTTVKATLNLVNEFVSKNFFKKSKFTVILEIFKRYRNLAQGKFSIPPLHHETSIVNLHYRLNLLKIWEFLRNGKATKQEVVAFKLFIISIPTILEEMPNLIGFREGIGKALGVDPMPKSTKEILDQITKILTEEGLWTEIDEYVEIIDNL